MEDKYILVLSENPDGSTDEICHWLLYEGKRIRRIHENSVLSNITINQTDQSFSLTADNVVIHSANISSYYYRRGDFAFNPVEWRNQQLTLIEEAEYNSLNHYYQKEWNMTKDYLHFLLKNTGIPRLNSYFDLKVNKLINHHLAKDLGLCVPDTIISNNFKEIEQFVSKHEKVIVKPIETPGDEYYISDKKYAYSQHTNLIDKESIQSLSGNRIQPSYFQAYIPKRFEIRSYYQKGVFYSMAIFSQNNKKTEVDFRNYDERYPNRNVPFLLPEAIKEKLSLLMQKLEYDTGSIDLIYNGKQYYFLEVNTVGQFSWVSKQCNYYLEKKIADSLL